MTKKTYRIRNKKTEKFISLGYARKSTWLTYPSQVLETSKHILELGDYELVVYEMKEVETIDL